MIDSSGAAYCFLFNTVFEYNRKGHKTFINHEKTNLNKNSKKTKEALSVYYFIIRPKVDKSCCE